MAYETIEPTTLKRKPNPVARSGSPPGTANQIHHGVKAIAASGTTPFMFVTR
jgi:hypothetical protein